MEENKKKEELQSRRGFFKSAAKKALPILAAVALANVPQIMKAAEETPSDCRYGCAGSCYSSCLGGCYQHCRYTCQGSCKESCQGTCRGYCTLSCTGSCSTSCMGTCSTSCVNVGY